MKRYRIQFYGRVQGVGFRYRSRSHAQALGLTGWVRNLWDDTVEMEVQGPTAKIEVLIIQIGQEYPIRIDRYYKEEISVEPEEREFKVVG
ncbi:MAG: acylphosphatase [Tissierellia bacterium]|nr:acylphosphatase [Tissierellia bacterium]